MNLFSIKRRGVMYVINHMLCGTRFFKLKRNLLRSIGYEIGHGTKIVGPLFNTGTLRIGEDCWIGRGLTIHGNGTVTIGDRCDIAPDVTFLTGGHRIGTQERRAGKGETYRISVGDGSWICSRVTILGNTEIGKGCVVAACACVTETMPDNCMSGGVPARIIRELEYVPSIISEE